MADDLYYTRKQHRVRAWQWNGQPAAEWPEWMTLRMKQVIMSNAVMRGTFILDDLEIYAREPKNKTMGPELFHSMYDPEPVEIPEMDNDTTH